MKFQQLLLRERWQKRKYCNPTGTCVSASTAFVLRTAQRLLLFSACLLSITDTLAIDSLAATLTADSAVIPLNSEGARTPHLRTQTTPKALGSTLSMGRPTFRPSPEGYWLGLQQHLATRAHFLPQPGKHAGPFVSYRHFPPLSVSGSRPAAPPAAFLPPDLPFPWRACNTLPLSPSQTACSCGEPTLRMHRFLKLLQPVFSQAAAGQVATCACTAWRDFGRRRT